MHKFIKNVRSVQGPDQKPYCFPNMPVGFAVDEKMKDKETVFRPIDFDGKGLRRSMSPAENNLVAENIKENAKDIEEEAYTKGFKKGERDGLALMREELEPVLNSFTDIILKFEETNKTLLLSAEAEAVELSLAIAEKIICHEVTINKEIIMNVAKVALKKIVDHKKIKIRLSPLDYEYLKDLKPEVLDFHDKFETLKFEEDPSITNGGCVIETELGDIDARIEKQLQVVKESFRSEIQKLRLGG